ncbi:MAG: RNA 2'-phosphotransferase [Myxococcota bacterium]|nr:RNA 2'-phosphotransferase [Myxococcota bacterium]
MSHEELILRLSQLLSLPPAHGGLRRDGEGFAPLDEAVMLLAGRGPGPSAEELRDFLKTPDQAARFELRNGHFRLRPCPAAVRQEKEGKLQPVSPAAVLYYATSSRVAEKIRRAGVIHPPRNAGLTPLFGSEAEALRMAGRLRRGQPRVLYVDVRRAVSAGQRFWVDSRNRYYTHDLQTRYILNMQPNFRHEVSSGAVVSRVNAEGIQFALARVERRGRCTWELPKGHLEQGETPADAAIRETREELGIAEQPEIITCLGEVRYGYYTLEGNPHLKTVHFYLVRLPCHEVCFHPQEDEGVVEVRWFTPAQALRTLGHDNLHIILNRAIQLLRAA